MRRLISLACLGAVIAAGTASLAIADTSPENAIKYRQMVMKAMGDHFGAFMLINMGRVDKQQYLASHAQAIADLGEQIPGLFPANSATGKTDALPAIWKETEKFQKAVDAGKAATAKLRDAVKSGDKAAIGQATKAAGEACKGCHDDFRKEEEKPKKPG